ncbi:hypothetical protein [Coprococcus catus]
MKNQDAIPFPDELKHLFETNLGSHFVFGHICAWQFVFVRI